METEARGGGSDLPKVTLGMRSGTQIEIAKPAPCPESEGLSASPPSCAGGARAAEVCEQELPGASCICRTEEIPGHQAGSSDRERLPKLSVFICRIQAACAREERC